MPNLTNHQISMVIGMSQAGLSNIEISRRFNIHRNTVTNTLKRYQATGSTSELPRSGRPRVTDDRDDLYIRTMHLRDRFRHATYTARNLPSLQRVSAQTVRNRLRERGIKAYRPLVKCSLTDRHKRNRLAWCTARVNWNYNQWRHVLFTDESPFGLQRKRGHAIVYRRRGELFTPGCID